MPYLELAYTDRSGTPHPQAMLVITAGRVQVNPNAAEFRLELYHDAAAQAALLPPFEVRDAVALSPDELQSLLCQFSMAVYQLLSQPPELAGSALVA